MARRYFTDNNWQTGGRADDEEYYQPRVQLSDGRWIASDAVQEGDVLAAGELDRAFQERMFGGGSPDPMVGAADFMQQNGLNSQQYQQATGGLPFAFNPDGTTTLDMGQRSNTYSYEAPETNWLHKIGPALMGGIAGAGLTGLLPGTTNIFSGFSNPFSGLSNFFGSGGEATAAFDPSSFFGQNGVLGISSEGVLPGGMTLGDLSGGVSSFADSASPWLSSGGYGAPGADLMSLANMPSMSVPGFGGLSASQIAQVLGTAGTSGSIPSFFGQFIDGAGNFASGGLNLANSASGLMSGLGTAANLLNQGGQQQQRGSNADYLSQLLGGAISPQGLNLLGQGLGTALGAYGANQQAKATSDLYDKFIGLGAPYRQQLNDLTQNPDSFYKSPVFQGALQQGSDALARSLSAKVGNPILNPTALQEMQNYTTRGSLDAYNNQFRNLLSAGQIGLGSSAQLGTNAANAQGGVADALGYGLSSVFNNRRDPMTEFAEALRRQPIGQSYLGGY
jgi:hypothetical protein